MKNSFRNNLLINALKKRFEKVDIKELINLLAEGDYDSFYTISIKEGDKESISDFLLTFARFLLDEGEKEVTENLLHRLLKDDKSVGEAAYMLGELFSREGRWKEAGRYIKQSMEISKKNKENERISRCFNLLGTIEGDKGDVRRAKLYFLEAIAVKEVEEELKNRIQINLGIIGIMEEKYEEAKRSLENAKSYYGKMKNEQRLGEIYINLGIVFIKERNYNKALQCAEKSVKYAEGEGLSYNIALGKTVKAEAMSYLGLLDEARVMLGEAMLLCRKLKDRILMTEIYKLKGIVERKSGNLKKASYYLLTGLRISREVKSYQEGEISEEISFLKEQMKKEQGKVNLKIAEYVL